MNSWLCAHMSVTPAFCTASETCVASSGLRHSGFSHRMCFPASAAARIAMVGEADVVRVDIGVLHQLLEVGVTGRAGLGLAAGQRLGVDVGGGGDFRAVGDGGVGVQMSGGDAAAAQDADADGGGNGGGGHGGS